jgi:hypothetical protein
MQEIEHTYESEVNRIALGISVAVLTGAALTHRFT